MTQLIGRQSNGEPLIGVLALQGDYPSHEACLARYGQSLRRISKREHLEGLDALILPGGESTTMLKLIAHGGLEEPLRSVAGSGIPVLATCAGLILLAREVVGREQRSLGLVDCRVERNGYGRQIRSGIKALQGEGLFPDCDGIFIRAPRILETGPDVEVLARWNDDPVLVRQGAILGASFHPELHGGEHPVTRLFLDAVAARAEKSIACWLGALEDRQLPSSSKCQ